MLSIVLPLSLTLPALAAEATLTGEQRLVGSQLSPFAVDAEGSTSGWEMALDNRSRLGAYGTLGELSWRAEVDVLSGRIAGDTWSVPGEIDERGYHHARALTLDGQKMRLAHVGGQAGPGFWQAGLQMNQWGLGVVANNGSQEPLFGWSDFGDRVFRIRYTALPPGSTPTSGTSVTVAADRVLADDIGRLVEGQAAHQGLVAVLHRSETGERGAYAAYRHQREDDRLTAAGVVDAYASHRVPVGEWTLRPAGEVAWIFGRTDLSTSYNAPLSTRLSSLGAAARVELAAPEDRVVLHARGGYASGDGDADDDVSHAFTFDRDFDAGFVLFEQVMGGIEAASHALLTDPGNTGEPPSGVDNLVTEGSFRQAIYAQPAVSARPLRWLDVRAGAVFAWSTVPVAQPFYSYRAGGIPTNHLEIATGDERYLGTELDWAAGVRFEELTDRPYQASLMAQGGHALLGPPLQGDAERVDMMALTARLRW